MEFADEEECESRSRWAEPGRWKVKVEFVGLEAEEKAGWLDDVVD